MTSAVFRNISRIALLRRKCASERDVVDAIVVASLSVLESGVMLNEKMRSLRMVVAGHLCMSAVHVSCKQRAGHRGKEYESASLQWWIVLACGRKKDVRASYSSCRRRNHAAYRRGIRQPPQNGSRTAVKHAGGLKMPLSHPAARTVHGNSIAILTGLPTVPENPSAPSAGSSIDSSINASVYARVPIVPRSIVMRLRPLARQLSPV